MYNKCGKMKIDMVEVESIENRIEILQNRLHKSTTLRIVYQAM